jgi:hypothetical protein
MTEKKSKSQEKIAPKQEGESNDFLPKEIFEPSKEELLVEKLKKLTGVEDIQHIKVQRTKGEIEDGWYVGDYKESAGKVLVLKENGDVRGAVLRKWVLLEDFRRLNGSAEKAISREEAKKLAAARAHEIAEQVKTRFKKETQLPEEEAIPEPEPPIKREPFIDPTPTKILNREELTESILKEAARVNIGENFSNLFDEIKGETVESLLGKGGDSLVKRLAGFIFKNRESTPKGEARRELREYLRKNGGSVLARAAANLTVKEFVKRYASK